MITPFSYIKSGIWTPKNASVSLLAWYRADSAVQSLGTVTSWPDQSGSGDANRNQSAFATPAYNAVDANYNGQPSVSSAGTSYFSSAGVWSVAPANPISIVVVGMTAASTAFLSAIAGGGTTAYDLLWSNGANALQFYNGGYGGGGSPSAAGVPVNAPCAIVFEDDGGAGGTASRLFVNNLSSAAATSTSAFTTTVGVDLMKSDAGVSTINGSLAEVLIYAGILSTADKTNLKAYLNTTRAYGIPVT